MGRIILSMSTWPIISGDGWYEGMCSEGVRFGLGLFGKGKSDLRKEWSPGSNYRGSGYILSGRTLHLQKRSAGGGGEGQSSRVA